ncbi:MAG TPA: polyamine ABC transporter ATP-binding protein, partial [Firmicutes bacterium]|nr:polyamine ABC transporter ATP-binding protein [Bacillota bacterium]
THDQEEAMAISDRIAVMNGGEIQHIGTPKNIYQRPANLFVACFIGRTNVMSGHLRIREEKAVLTMGGYSAELPTVAAEYEGEQDVMVSLRPEELILSRDEHAVGMKAVVEDAVFLGLNTHYFVKFSDGQEAEIIQESTIEDTLPRGAHISLGINTDKVNVFTADGKNNILTGVQNDITVK